MSRPVAVRRATASITACVGLSALLASPASAAPTKIADARVEIPIASTSKQTDVISSVVRLHVPMLPGAAPHPEACDWISFQRWRSQAGPAAATDADAVAVLFPGVLEGATAFDGVARNTIREANRRGRSVEVWGIDRRSNCMEDHTGVDEATKTGDASDAVDYYYGGKAIDGKRFAGFGVSDRVLADIGMAQTMHDYNAVLTSELPSQPWREKHVICGGHSMGGPLTEIYAGWDFDGNKATTEDAGYRQCAGFIGFDTVLNAGSIDERLRPSKDLLGKLTSGLLGSVNQGTVKAIKAGTIPRHVDLLGINQESMTALELIAVVAERFPEADSGDLIKSVPRSRRMDDFFRIAGSPDLASYLGGKATLRDLRYTNMALLGQVMDDNGAAYGLVRTSFGYFDGAPLRRNLMSVQSQLIPGLGALVSPGQLMIPQKLKNQPLMRWRNYDDLGAGAEQIGRGITSPDEESTDATEFARAIHEGPLNLTENWFPIRLIVDEGLLAVGDRSGSLAGAMHGRTTTRKPRITVLATGGRFDRAPLDPFVPAAGYQHLDVLTSAERQTGGKPEISSQTLANLIDTAVAP